MWHLAVSKQQRLFCSLKYSTIYTTTTYNSFNIIWIMLQIKSCFTLDEHTNPHSALKNMTKLLQTEFSFYITTIQIEAYSEKMAYCNKYQDTMEWVSVGNFLKNPAFLTLSWMKTNVFFCFWGTLLLLFFLITIIFRATQLSTLHMAYSTSWKFG